LGIPGENGWEMWFFHSDYSKAATGFLEERLKSQRRKLKPKQLKKADFIGLRENIDLDWTSDQDEGKRCFTF
jgi:hypothetical protein